MKHLSFLHQERTTNAAATKNFPYVASYKEKGSIEATGEETIETTMTATAKIFYLLLFKKAALKGGYDAFVLQINLIAEVVNTCELIMHSHPHPQPTT